MRRLRHRASAVAVIASAAMLLAACGGGSGSDSSGSASGGSLDIYITAQPNFPDAFATWSKDITAAFKAATGADLTIETYSSAADETTKIQSSIVAGSGPDVYQLGTTFTPVAYGTKGFLNPQADDWTKVGGKERFRQSLGMSGPDATPDRHPGGDAPLRHGLQHRHVQGRRHHHPADHVGRLRHRRQEADQPATGVYGLPIGYADGFDPWKFIWSITEQAGG